MKIHYLMRQLGIRSTATAIISVFWMSSIHALTASYIPETTPRPGEQRFSSFVFKATHNSYERNKPLDVQIDNYNVWQIELDCSWDTKDFGGIVVDHDCVGAKGRSLATVFDELNNSVTLNSKFTMIYMELKSKSIGQECREEWPSDNATYRDFIYDEIDTYLDVNRVYTPKEFLDTDNLKWPSWQELVRRGKNYCFVLQELQAAGNDNNDFFFNQEHDDPPGTNSDFESQVLISKSGGSDGFLSNNTIDPTYDRDRYIWRAFPALPSCIDTDGSGAASFWVNMVDRGYNFVASNCVDDDDQVLDARTHSPQPLYINETTTNEKKYGTLGWPMKNLMDGINRASPWVDVVVSGGEYDISNGSVITKPVYIWGSSGSVIIK